MSSRESPVTQGGHLPGARGGRQVSLCKAESLTTSGEGDPGSSAGGFAGGRGVLPAVFQKLEGEQSCPHAAGHRIVHFCPSHLGPFWTAQFPRT